MTKIFSFCVHILEPFFRNVYTFNMRSLYVANSTWPVELPLLVLEEDKKLPVFNHVKEVMF